MKINFEYQTELVFYSPAQKHKFLLKILPSDDSRQCIVSLTWRIGPHAVFWYTNGSFGNAALAGYIDGLHNGFQFGINGIAEVSEQPYLDCPEPERVLRYPSELTLPGAPLAAFYKRHLSAAPEEFLPRIEYFSHAVHKHMRYERGITTNSSTAQEAFAAKAGVCQDYAHILLALLRLDNIPCRYVAGLASDYGETHAWVEAWAEGKYFGIDPTRDKLIDEYYIALSRGRDFHDCSV
ncbi:MAG: transglutaminase family protein, partial [Lachnospiraceae bacterium]|nr:transglutaminase family protein [Lachnospiraceae bacterium]